VGKASRRALETAAVRNRRLQGSSGTPFDERVLDAELADDREAFIADALRTVAGDERSMDGRGRRGGLRGNDETWMRWMLESVDTVLPGPVPVGWFGTAGPLGRVERLRDRDEQVALVGGRLTGESVGDDTAVGSD
jgi:hypothetical protein